MSARSYAREKFELAMSNMAIDPNGLEERIYSAFLTIQQVKPEAFEGEEDLQEGWNDLQRMFKDAQAGTNSLERGLSKIDEDQVQELARQIVLVAGRLRQGG